MFRSRYFVLSFLLIAVLGFVFVPFAANADPAWPTNLRVRYYRFASPTDNGVVSTHYLGYSGLNGARLAVNWCKAKETLPAGWDTQDDRRLRTDSMCAEAPMYTGLGNDEVHPWGVGRFKFMTREWTVPGSHAPGRYIFSVNFWNGWVHHHAEGNHTILALIELKHPPRNRGCIGRHYITGPGFEHCHP